MNAASTGAALTFDDGLDPVWTPGIPEGLCEADASATLFVISPLALGYPSLIEATLQAGHGVEFHCYEHLRNTRTPREKIETDTPRMPACPGPRAAVVAPAVGQVRPLDRRKPRRSRRLPDGGVGISHRPRHAGLRLRSAEGVGPVERWSDERFLWHYFLRRANEEDLPGL